MGEAAAVDRRGCGRFHERAEWLLAERYEKTVRCGAMAVLLSVTEPLIDVAEHIAYPPPARAVKFAQQQSDRHRRETDQICWRMKSQIL